MTADTRAETRPRLEPHHVRVIAILLSAVFVVLLNETTMNIAIERMTEDPSLDIDARGAAWLTTSFLLTMSVVIPTTGWLQKRFNTRPLFIASTSLFTLGTLIALVSPGFALLLVGRVVQASGTAIAMPLLMSTVMEVVPASMRGRVMGLVSMVISVAPALGPVVSGVILAVWDWRAIFAVMVPIGLTCLAVGWRFTPNVAEVGRASLDFPSVPLSAPGFGLTVYGLSSVGNETLPGWVMPASLSAGVLILCLFVLRQASIAKSGTPLLDVRVFAVRRFTIPLLVVMLAFMGMFGVLIMLPLLLQRSFGMDALAVGMLMLPGSLLTGILGPIVGNIFDRVGPRPLVVPGTGLAVAAFSMLFFVGQQTPIWYFLVFHIILSVGLACTFSPTFTSALGSLPHSLYSYGSATVSTMQQVAGAAGNSGFMAIVSIGLSQGLARGESQGQAMLAGAHNSFAVALVILLAAFSLSWFVRRPDVHEAH